MPHELPRLIYELLDAHRDTIDLVGEGSNVGDGLVWRAHLDYLRALQRVGRAILARAEAREVPSPAAYPR
jgi:NAD(P)H-hydrate repair Nnr-like enzyme with NAD(P)H-hydrate epimerase domain